MQQVKGTGLKQLSIGERLTKNNLTLPELARSMDAAFSDLEKRRVFDQRKKIIWHKG